MLLEQTIKTKSCKKFSFVTLHQIFNVYSIQLQAACNNGFLGMGDSCIHIPHNLDKNYTVFEAATECFNQKSSLMSFKSNETLKILLNDIVPFLPFNIKHIENKKWFGGVFVNPSGLILSSASGEFLYAATSIIYKCL